MGLLTPCIVPKGRFFVQNYCPRGRVFAPFKSCPGGLWYLHKSTKGHVKLIQLVKIAHSFSVSCLNCSTPSFPACLGSSTSDRKRSLSNPAAKTGEIVAFYIHSHSQLTTKVGLSIQLNCRPTLQNDLFFF